VSHILRLLGLATLALLVLSVFVAPARQVIPQAKLAASTGSWTQYHKDNGHTGYDSSLPTMSTVTPGWISGAMDGEVYASPLVFNGVVYSATLNNSVYAFRQSDGVTLWSKNLGAPQTSGWGCGNVSPMGILGTPVIDTVANRIYAVALIAGTTPTYHLFGLDLANAGNIVLNTAMTPTGFDWRYQQERGALSIANGNVYVPMGGRWGDCGTYAGWVVGVPTSGAAPFWYKTACSNGCGIWAAGGVVVDGSGNVFAATGNGDCSTVAQNDAVVRLTPALALADYFMPPDWQANYCTPDEDLGGAGPLLISPTLLFQAGKRGGGFLLNPAALGGVGGQSFPTPKPQTYAQAEVCLGNHGGATFGSFAYAAPYIYLQCEGRGLTALNLNTGTPSFSICDATCAAPSWNAGGGASFGPPIVAGGAVWVVDSSGLAAYNATTGALVYQSAAFGVNRFVTPAEAGGSVYVPSGTVIRSFDMQFLNWTSLGGGIIGGPDASSWGSTRVDVFVRGSSDSGLWHRMWNGTTWAGWESLGGVMSADPSAVSWGANRIDIFVRGTNNSLWHRSSDGTTWATWENLGGVLTSSPDAASWGVNQLDVFVRGTDNALWRNSYNGTTWTWTSLGGVLTSDPGAVSSAANRIDVFVRGTDSGLWQASWNGTTWSWTSLGGGLTAGPDVSSCSAGHLDVFVTGTDGSIWQRGYNGTTWLAWKPWGGAVTAGPGVVCPTGTTSAYLFERGTDGGLWQTTITGS
jgi:hypothetical protein